MAIWVQVQSIYYGEKNGKTITYYSGDWVKVSRTRALYLQGEGIAKIPNNTIYKSLAMKDCGIATMNGEIAPRSLPEHPAFLSVQTVRHPSIPYGRTIIWDVNSSANVPLFLSGLELLGKWDILAPIASYEKLASDSVSEDDAKWALETLPDLRLPLFNISLLFVTKNVVCESLITLWNEFTATGHASDISFLVAVYETKPLLLSLPIVWTNSSYE